MSVDTFQLARQLRSAYTEGGITALSASIENPSVELAYEVQARNTDHWRKEGRRVVGRKIGLTSVAVQTQLGVDQPDYGTLFADMVYADGGIVPMSRLCYPRAEVEVALVLKHALDMDHPTVADVIRATDFVIPAIEIADSRVKNWKITIFDTIADNASAGVYVLGTQPKSLSEVDLRLCGMRMLRGGEPVSTGVGAACMGNPLRAAAWLAQKMVTLGEPLQAGDTVLTGALGPMVDVHPGDHFRADISGLGSVSVSFSQD